MGLTVRRLKFVDFRNYRELDLDGLGKLTVFVGPNAVGKTNIIEGIQLLTAQTSFLRAGKRKSQPYSALRIRLLPDFR